MGYTGPYTCPVAGCGFVVDVTMNRYEQTYGEVPKLIRGTAAAGRETMLAHGEADHRQNWNTVSNEIFVAPVPTP